MCPVSEVRTVLITGAPGSNFDFDYTCFPYKLLEAQLREVYGLR